MGSLQVRTDPDPYVMVTIPRSLEASARVAIAGLYQPFFVEWTEAGIVLVTRGAEWAHVADRFPGAVMQTGFRLISLGAPAGEGNPDRVEPNVPVDLKDLTRRLAERDVRVRPLRSFYRDHLLVREEDLAACLGALAAPPGVTPAGPASD